MERENLEDMSHLTISILPEGDLTIARQFTAGISGPTASVPKGRLRTCGCEVMQTQPSLRDFGQSMPDQALKRKLH